MNIVGQIAFYTVIGMAVGYMTVKTLKDKDKEVPVQEKEFVCYDDGTLVERHVGVKDASQFNGHWKIRYVDSDIVALYFQPHGETCQVEIVL